MGGGPALAGGQLEYEVRVTNLATVAAQNVVITTFDCGTAQGIPKGTVYQGDKVAVTFVDSVRGRIALYAVVDPRVRLG